MKAIACTLSILAGLAFGAPAWADQQIYQYRVDHHTYGDIGSYTNTIDRNGAATNVTTDLHVAVKILGIVMFRQDAARIERWQGDRLVYFHSVTVTNGDRLEVTGEAKGDEFHIMTPQGVVDAPADVRPSNPWSEMSLQSDALMSTKTGQVQHVEVTGGEEENVTLDGSVQRLRQYEVHGDKHEVIWLDSQGLPVAFRIEEDGTPIDFIMKRQVATR
jgi:hypothetical protein